MRLLITFAKRFESIHRTGCALPPGQALLSLGREEEANAEFAKVKSLAKQETPGPLLLQRPQ